MRRTWVNLLGLLGFFLSVASFSMKVDSLFRADVLVKSQAPELRLEAVQEGLKQVLSKLSGNPNIINNPEIKSQLEKADRLTEEFGYSPSPSTPETPYIMHMKFNENGVKRILKSANVPTWSQNRPVIVAWIEYEAPGAPAILIDSESKNPVQTFLKKDAINRGLPLLLPLMDVMDMSHVTINDVMTMSLPALEKASERYSNDGILVARIFHVATGYSVQSKFVLRGNEWTWYLDGVSPEDVLASLLGNIQTILTDQPQLTNKDGQLHNVTLKIVGIEREEDLSEVVERIRNLTPVTEVEPEQISTENVVLNVRIKGSKENFENAISDEGKFQLASDANESVLVYQWNP